MKNLTKIIAAIILTLSFTASAAEMSAFERKAQLNNTVNLFGLTARQVQLMGCKNPGGLFSADEQSCRDAYHDMLYISKWADIKHTPEEMVQIDATSEVKIFIREFTAVRVTLEISPEEKGAIAQEIYQSFVDDEVFTEDEVNEYITRRNAQIAAANK